MIERGTMERLLERARWAPSGDNTQPWRFEVLGDDRVAIHGFDTRADVVYDFDGRPSQLAHGALLETLRLAASRVGLRAEWSIRAGSSEHAPIYDVVLIADPALQPDPLEAFIESRVVQRRPMRVTALGPSGREALAAAVGPDFRLRFFEGFDGRWQVAKLLWRSARIRLTMPEALHVHRSIIEWGARFSEDRIPEQAVGVDPGTARLMRWVMANWDRVDFFNRYLLGTVAPRVQLDLLPALGCAAHVLMTPVRPLRGLADFLAAGMAMQRLWLATEAAGMHLQPQMTPVIFRWYAQAGRRLSARPGIDREAGVLARRFDALAEAAATDDFAFFCRVGVSLAPRSRSLRRPLPALLTRDSAHRQ